MDTEDNNIEQESDARKRRQAIAITGLGSIADLTAIAQLITSTIKLGALVFGLISVAISCVGLIRLWGSNFGRPVAGMVVLLIIGSCATGIALAGSWNQTTGDGERAAAGPTQTQTTSALAPPLASHLQSPTTASSNASEPSPTSIVRGANLGANKLDLHDGDVADLKMGTVSHSGMRSDLTYSYSDGIKYAFLAISAAGPDHYMALAPQDPTFEQCVNLLKVRHDRDEKISGPGVGAWYCVGTGDYNVAAVQVQKLPTDAQDPVTISYKLWKG